MCNTFTETRGLVNICSTILSRRCDPPLEGDDCELT